MVDEAALRRAFECVRVYQDFPEPGIRFYDVFSLFADAATASTILDALTEAAGSLVTDRVDVVAGLDARGFLFGPTIAQRLGCAFVPVRKAGKLPGKTFRLASTKEYGADVLEIPAEAVQPGARVLIVDDLIATGGTAAAAASLVRQCGGSVVGAIFVFNVCGLNGGERLGAPWKAIFDV